MAFLLFWIRRHYSPEIILAREDKFESKMKLRIKKRAIDDTTGGLSSYTRLHFARLPPWHPEQLIMWLSTSIFRAKIVAFSNRTFVPSGMGCSLDFVLILQLLQRLCNNSGIYPKIDRYITRPAARVLLDVFKGLFFRFCNLYGWFKPL